jgi:tetratricopeptide (TPR) repeat protein
MYNAIDWSYSLLEECDKRLLQRLSVFNGGWTVEAAVAVCADEEQPQVDILDGIERLVDNSLLLSTGEEPGEVRMRVLESIREFASEHLIQGGEADTIRYRYAHYYLVFAKQAEVELQGAAQYTWHRQVETELDNLRAVMDWAIRSEKRELALQITLPLHRFWWTYGCWTEAFRWLKLAMAHQEDLPDELNAKALTECGWFYRNLGDYQQSITMLEESIALWQLVGDEQGFAVALLNMGASFLRLGNIDEANRYLGQALEISRRIGDTLNTYQALELLGHTASKQGDIGKGSQLYSEALALAEEVNDDAQVAKLLNNLGDNYVISGDHIHAEECFSRSAVICKKQGNRIVGAYISGNRSIIAMKLGDYSKAFDLLVEAMLVVKESGDKENTILCLEPFAYVAAELGEPARAARLFGASESLRLSIGMTRQYQMQDDYETYVDKLKSQLGEAAFKDAWENGSNLTLDQAVAYAIQGKE